MKNFKYNRQTINCKEEKEKNQTKFTSCIMPFAFCFLLSTPNAQTQSFTLQNALDLATKNYPTLQQASLQTEQQQALTKTATVLDPFNINSNLGQINSKLFDYNIGVAQGFNLLNKANRNLLNQNVAVAKSFEAVTKNELVKNVSNAYFNWLYNVQQYDLLLETDNIFADYEKYADKKF